ncbi:Ig-like domain repeat protein [Mumia zhuanghuii]|uniref:Bacterial Ig-like domain-containing protein n=1 Tax=Mumia zhuanghuii TaxID=2585211 RepID=A0A5C4MK67_9ACTN|nr:Ig-like domain repeat protein [Mumia zhuanghuii]TNC36549.1 hypothetical protein FHE65_25920 [Mumia zhuanghuii]TNC42502.1 hypothetical protein FHE65_20985 [Mumia zhuanghuii]
MERVPAISLGRARGRLTRAIGAAGLTTGLTLAGLAAPAEAVTPVPLADAGSIVAWGDPSMAPAMTVPAAVRDTAFSAVEGGAANFTIALTANSRVLAWGEHQFGATKVPTSLASTKVKAIAASSNNAGAVTQAGTVVVWGLKASVGGPHQVPAGLSGVVDLALGDDHGVAVKSDGTVVAWGTNRSGALDVPAGLSGVKKVEAGPAHSYALRSDGTVVAWGRNDKGQLALPPELTLPGNVKDVAALSMGGLALLADGTVRSWGTTTGDPTIPASLEGRTVVAIAANGVENVALDSEGRLTRWGDNFPGSGPALSAIPKELDGAPISAVASGGLFNIALVRDLKVGTAPAVSGTVKVGQTLTGIPGAFSGSPDSVTSQWLVNGAPVAGATGTTFALTAAHLGKRISYRSTATKGAITKTSTSAQTAAVASNKTTPVVGVSAPASTYGRTVNATITVNAGATGTVPLTLDGRTLGTKTLAGGRTAYALPRTTNPGRHTLRAVYNGNTTHNATTRTATWTVAKTRPGTVKTKITKKPSRKKKGKATVTIARPAGLAAPGGKVTITLKKGKKTLRAKGAVRNGKATVTLPKTAKGTWKITTTYSGDTRYLPAKAKTLKHKSR